MGRHRQSLQPLPCTGITPLGPCSPLSACFSIAFCFSFLYHIYKIHLQVICVICGSRAVLMVPVQQELPCEASWTTSFACTCNCRPSVARLLRCHVLVCLGVRRWPQRAPQLRAVGLYLVWSWLTTWLDGIMYVHACGPSTRISTASAYSHRPCLQGFSGSKEQKQKEQILQCPNRSKMLAVRYD